MKRTNLQRCFVLFFSACMTTSLLAADLINWAPDIATARQAAVAQNKLMLIHFWTPDCPPCKIVDRQVFPAPSVAQTIHENFVPLKINAYEHADLRLQFQVDRWPTDVIATADGQIVHKMVTPPDPHEYVRQLAAIAVANNPRPVNPSTWADGPRADAQFVGGPKPGRDSRLGEPLYSFAEYGTNSTLMRRRLDQGFTTPNRFASRYYKENSKPDSVAAQHTSSQPLRIANQYAADPARGATNQWTNIGRQTNEITNPYITSAPATPQTKSHNPSQNLALLHQGNNRTYAPTVQRPPIRPPLGLDGRCPVTLVRERVWQKGDTRWGAIHRGRTYLFAGIEQQQEFLAHPDLFSPVLAGMDVVRLAEAGQIVQGNRRYGVVFDDDGQGPQPSRIYLFDSVDSRNRFEERPDRYLQPVLQAMRQGTLDTLLR